MEIRNYYDGNEYITRIDHILQKSVLTELLMGFLPLEEWGNSFMLTVESKPSHQVLTAAIVAYLSNVRILLFEAPPGCIELIVSFLLDHNIKFPNNSVAGPSREVAEFCQVWADRTGYQYNNCSQQRVYGIQDLPILPKRFKPPFGRIRKATSNDSTIVAQMYRASLDEMHSTTSHNDTQKNKRISTGEVYVVNSCISEGKVFLWEDNTIHHETVGNDEGIVSILFCGDIKLEVSAEITMVYTTPSLRKKGYGSALVAEVGRCFFEEGICFLFVLEDAQIPTANYKYLTDLGFRLDEYHNVCNLNSIEHAIGGELQNIGEISQEVEMTVKDTPLEHVAATTMYSPDNVDDLPNSGDTNLQQELPGLSNTRPSLPPPLPPKPNPLPPHLEASKPPNRPPPPRPPTKQPPPLPQLPPPVITAQRPPPPPLPTRSGRPPRGEYKEAVPFVAPSGPLFVWPPSQSPQRSHIQSGHFSSAEKARFSVLRTQTINATSISHEKARSAEVSSVQSPALSGSSGLVRTNSKPVLEKINGLTIPIMPAPSLAKSSSGASLTPLHTEVVQEGRLYHPTRDRPMNTGKRLPKRKSYERNQSAHLALSSPPSKATLRESAAERATAEEPHRMSFVITDTRTLQAKGSPFTVYVMLVKRGPTESYTIARRYSQFLQFHKSLSDKVSPSILPPFPGKTLFVKKTSSELVEQRRSILQEYMNKVVLLAEVLTLCAADLKELLQPGPGDAEIKYL